MPRATLITAILLGFLAAPTGARGQAGNHWTEQFGNRSMLLSGAVVGSVSDLGLVFYNPGRLGLIEKPAFVLTAKAYQWDNLRLEDGLGEGVDLKDSSFGGAPSLAAGVFKVPFLGGQQFAYAFLTRRRDDTDVFLRTERSGDLVEGLPGEEFFVGTADIGAKLKEEWIGLTWAHAVGEHWSLGLSGFYYNLSRNATYELDLRAVSELNQVAILDRRRTVSYSDQGLLWKAGLAGVFYPFTLGVTVTSPRVSVRGSGRIQYEDLLAGLDPDNDQTPDNALITSVQKGLSATTRSPWAVGAGVGIERGRAAIHLAGEWYSAVPKYVVTEADPFEGQSSGEVLEYRIVEELESVINGAVGIEWHQGELLSLYGSFATNRSAAPEERSSFLELADEVTTTTIRADYLQVGGGFVLSTSYVELTLGGTYTWASEGLRRPINLPDEGDEPIFGADANARFVSSRWRFLLGFTFPLADQLKDRVTGETEGG